MSNQKNIKKVLSLGDFFAVLVILIGIIIAFVLEEIAIRMIGVSISILGSVALFMSISQRMASMIEPKFSAPKTDKEYKMTVLKDAKATRQTIEDFKDTFSEDSTVVTATVDNIGDDESEMRIIGKITSDIPKPVVIETISNLNNTNEQEFNDGFSSVRIVRKFKPSPIDQIQKDIPAPEAVKFSTEPVVHEVVERIVSEPIIFAQDDTANTLPESIMPEPILAQQVEPQPAMSEVLRELTDEINQIIGTDAAYPEDMKPEPEVISLFDDYHFDDTSNIKTLNIPIQEKAQIGTEKVLIEERVKKQILYKDIKLDIAISAISEVDPLIGDEPRKQFEYFMSRILMIIRSITNTRTAVFLLNDNGQEFILDSFATSVPNSITKKVKYHIGHDIVSQIFLNSKPEILTEINPAAELDLIPYYSEAVGTVSFIGIPVFQNDIVIGVLCADSEVADAYDSWTVNFLGHFSKLIAALVLNFSRQFDLLQAAKTLEAINVFYNVAANSKYGNENVSESIVEALSKMFDTSKIGIVGYDGSNQTWEIKATLPPNSNENGKVLDLSNSLIGKTIYECQVYNVLNSEIVNSTKIYSGENSNPHSIFVSVPIISPTSVYGAIYLETKPGINFTAFDMSILRIIGEHAGNAIEKLHFMEMFHSSQIIDQSTGLLNPHALYARINEEYNRSKDFKTPMTLCLIKLDNYLAADPIKFPNRFTFATQNTIEITRKYLKQYDIFGKVDNDTFGVLLIGKDCNQSKMHFDKVRSEIANSILNIDGAKFNITISMGMALADKSPDVNTFINNANLVLKKSLEKSNTITVYN